MLLSILQCTGQPPQQRFISAQKLVVLRLRSPHLDSGGNSGTKNEAINYEGRLDGLGYLVILR